jgi:hypothetical protein
LRLLCIFPQAKITLLIYDEFHDSGNSGVDQRSADSSAEIEYQSNIKFA